MNTDTNTMGWQKLSTTPEGYHLWTRLDDTGREIFKYERTQPSATEGGYYDADSAAKLKNLQPRKWYSIGQDMNDDKHSGNPEWPKTPTKLEELQAHADKLAEALRDLRTRVIATGPDCLNTTRADEALAAYESEGRP